MKRWIKNALLFFLSIAALTSVILLLHVEQNIFRENVMRYQLQALRTTVLLFRVLEHRNPAGWQELRTAEYQFPGDVSRHHYLEGMPQDNAGKPVDPFGRAYVYDPKTGWVLSATVGFLEW